MLEPYHRLVLGQSVMPATQKQLSSRKAVQKSVNREKGVAGRETSLRMGFRCLILTLEDRERVQFRLKVTRPQCITW